MKKLSTYMIIVLLILSGCASTAKPQAGATFSGSIEVNSEDLESARVSFTVSEDGASITMVSVTFTKFKCGSMSAGGSTLNSTANSPVSNKFDISLSNIGQIKGNFTSPTTASGTIHLELELAMGLGSPITCDLGTWNWSATAE